MSERDTRDWSGEGKPMAAEVSERLRSILGDAESAADAIRHQAESDAQARRRAAETEALKIIEDARREAERFLADRIHRVSELSDEILERGQSVVERLDEAEQVRSELAGLVRSLGETAARLANEVRAMPGPQTLDVSAGSYAPPAPEPSAAPEPPSPAPEPDPPAPEAELKADPEPVEPEQESEPPPAEPTPLRPALLEPNTFELAPAPKEEAETEPTPEEIELLERVRAAERERAGEPGDTDPAPEALEADSNGASAGTASDTDTDTDTDTDGDGPELVEVVTEPEDVRADPSRPGAGPDQALGARLVALQMAVAGGNRGEVEAHLRRAFDLDEPGGILDDIFGSGTDAEKRVAWPEAG